MGVGKWTIDLQAFRDHVTEMVMKDADGPIDLDGWWIAVEVTHDEGEIIWSTATGHIAIDEPTTPGKATLTVPKAEIATAPFDWANFRLFAGPDEFNPDLIYSGKVRRQ